MRTIIRTAWLSSTRQPARSGLGVLGVMAIGALLFDMLLLSQGLVLSFRDLLDREGFDVRVLASDTQPVAGLPLDGATATAGAIAALPEVSEVTPLRLGEAELVPAGDRETRAATPDSPRIQFIGADPGARPAWTILTGHDLSASADANDALLIDRAIADDWHLSVGSVVSVRATCDGIDTAVPPRMLTVRGIADFPFDAAATRVVAGSLTMLRHLCGIDGDDRADMLVVRSNPSAGAAAAAAAIRTIRPDLYVVTNEQLIERFSRVEFSYFRQIAFVLSTLTVFFGFLLIAVLLTVQVNQRLGEIAALRAIGLTRTRVMAGVLCESALVVGVGGVLAVPVGLLLARELDRILRALPGIPMSVSFFVFEPRSLVVYAALLGTAAVAAAIYPMRIVGALPIAATLRREVVS